MARQPLLSPRTALNDARPDRGARRRPVLEPFEREDEVLERICEEGSVDVHFQPIIRLDSGDIYGYEALARPPLDGPFATATQLFRAAARHDLLTELELVCCEKAVRRFVKAALRGKLLLNLSPESIVDAQLYSDARFDFLRHPGLETSRVVVELAEQQRDTKLESLCEAVMLFRSLGADIAVNDLGNGFSSLWLWSELRPELVKVGVQFTHGVHRNPVKYQFLRSLQQVADSSGARLVAEGIEDRADYAALREMGITYGQGNLIARPSPSPSSMLKGEIVQAVRSRGLSTLPEALRLPSRRVVTGDKLLIPAQALAPTVLNDRVMEAFDASPGLHAIAVVEGEAPVGLIHRNDFLTAYGRAGGRETYGTQPCSTLMDSQPLVLERTLSIEEISGRLISADLRHLDAFVFTDAGRYAGVGVGQDLIREILLMQVEAARYANPLTQLPGNVPIDEQITELLASRTPFVAAYCDLNHFKPFNDAYGYRRGDEMIRLAARVLSECCHPGRDFIGHIGGDDFIVLFRSPDWKNRCEKALLAFAEQAKYLFDEEDRDRGRLEAEDRGGRRVQTPLASLAIGVVPVAAGAFDSHLAVSEAAAEAKKQAKRIGGNTLFVERRRHAPNAGTSGE